MADTNAKSGKPTAIELIDVDKTIDGNEILHKVNLAIQQGELTLIAGESGSGKSTLLSCMGGLDTVSDGEVRHGGVNIGDLTPVARDRWRGRNIGFVFQDSLLINGLDVASNIVAPYELTGVELDYNRIARICKVLGIYSRMSDYPRTLSGGEKQRIAIARALAHHPDVLFADEPTASLDMDNKHRIHSILMRISRIGTTVVMASHDSMSPSYADRMITLADGRVVQDIHASNKPKETL